MITAIESLSPLHVLIVSVIGFVLGALWFSPLMFVKPWFVEMKYTSEILAELQKDPRNKLMLPKCFLWTMLSTVTLGALLAANHTAGAVKGLEMGLFVGIGIVGARASVNGMFERRTMRHLMITTGHDIALLALQGAILGVWR
ncbi:MAG TPA: DUF1761 domain-containing protein [Opitutaceae bacterium]|jgi:hypothetical protein|nr:DUF1761 domain-containing protein [Opitutaceae bacterium]